MVMGLRKKNLQVIRVFQCFRIICTPFGSIFIAVTRFFCMFLSCVGHPVA